MKPEDLKRIESWIDNNMKAQSVSALITGSVEYFRMTFEIHSKNDVRVVKGEWYTEHDDSEYDAGPKLVTEDFDGFKEDNREYPV